MIYHSWNVDFVTTFVVDKNTIHNSHVDTSLTTCYHCLQLVLLSYPSVIRIKFFILENPVINSDFRISPWPRATRASISTPKHVNLRRLVAGIRPETLYS